MRMSTEFPLLICGECLDVISGFPSDLRADMVLADLPYGTTQNKWDSPIDLIRMWLGFDDICRPDGAVVLTAIQPFSSKLVASNFDDFRYEWIWSKNKSTGHLNAKRRPLRAHESILVFSRETHRYFPQMTSGHRPGNYAKQVKMTSNYGSQRTTEYGGSTLRYPNSVQNFPVLNNDDAERVHSTQKPVDLLRYLIRTYTEKDDIVLDPTMGSGSTGVACAMEGRRFIGIEKERQFFDVAEGRVLSAYQEVNNATA
jgi:DNA modification methylase